MVPSCSCWPELNSNANNSTGPGLVRYSNPVSECIPNPSLEHQPLGCWIRRFQPRNQTILVVIASAGAEEDLNPIQKSRRQATSDSLS
ncbi:hypothetical protein AcV5_007544 [Taiwanofungus camphoratus]|nr:hypothetical protein AcW2_007202 [Antrodia cinnamomea]KAI0926862.1 hypothetical protein AcV5_007544 [Antrodia cinnamomea]